MKTLRVFFPAFLTMLVLATAISAPPPSAPQPRNAHSHHNLAYVDAGHPRQKLDLYIPRRGSGPWPVIIWVHGGGWQSGSKNQCLPLRLGFIDRGFAMASIGYRLSSDAIFPAQIEDVKSAVRWLRANADKFDLDSNRFGAWGSSAGGHLVALLGTTGHTDAFNTGTHPEVSSAVQAVCDFFGPIDLVEMAQTPGYTGHARPDSPESRLLGGPVLERRELARKANPITYVDPVNPPFLIIHGSEDPVVPPQQGQLLLEAFQEAGVPAIYRVIDGARHGGPQFNNPAMGHLVEKFFRQAMEHSVSLNNRILPAASEPAAEVSSSLPNITELEVDGDYWTCLADGRPMSGRIHFPEGSGPFPAILVSHGRGGTADGFAMPKAEEMATWGFASIATDYTHAGGQPDTERLQMGSSAENIWRARVCLAILEQLPKIDASRTCLYGNSMGAFLSIGLAAAEPDRILAVAITAGGISSEPGYPAPTPAVAEQIRTPFLILHGSEDRVVRPEQSAELASILKRNGINVEHKIFPGIGHNLHRDEATAVYRLKRDWFIKQGALPPIESE